MRDERHDPGYDPNADRVYRDPPPRCQWCDSRKKHKGMCPAVREIQYYSNGTVKRVIFHRKRSVR